MNRLGTVHLVEKLKMAVIVQFKSSLFTISSTYSAIHVVETYMKLRDSVAAQKELCAMRFGVITAYGALSTY